MPGRRSRTRSEARAARPTTRPPRPAPAGRSPRSARRRRRRACRPGSRGRTGRAAGGTGETSTTDGLPSASNSSGTTPTAPGRADDVAVERLAVGRLEVGDRHVPDVTLVDSPLAEVPKPGGGGLTPTTRRHLPSSTTTDAGLGASRHAERGADQLAEQRMGRSGRLLNSGWACVPTQNGWSGELDELDQAPSGDMPAAAQAGGLRAAASVLRVQLVAVAVTLADDRLAVGRGAPGCRWSRMA